MQRLRQILPAVLFGLALLSGLIFLKSYNPTLLDAQRGAGFDTLQRLWPRDNIQQPVRIIDIDERSLREIGQWPWQRTRLARLVDDLYAMGAAVVAFDIIFPEPDRLSPHLLATDPDVSSALLNAGANLDKTTLPNSDASFAAAIAGRPIVLAFSAGTLGNATDLPVKHGLAQTGAPAGAAPLLIKSVTSNLPSFNAAAAGLGGINLDLSGEQGIARQIPLVWTDGQRFLPSLAVEALRVAQGADTLLVHADPDFENTLDSLVIGEVEVPVSDRGLFYVHYRKNPVELYVSAADILSGQKRETIRPLIEGHIVFVGTSAVGLLDIRTTALGENVPGVSIHAQAVEQMLSFRSLSRPDWIEWLELLGTVCLGLIIIGLSTTYRPWIPMAAAALGIAAAVGSSAYAFTNLGLLVDSTFPTLALATVFLASTAFRLLVTDRQGRFMRRAFGQYVAPSVLAEIEKNPESFKLGGEVREVTVLFVDIANFTPLSERLKPDELVKVVNGLWDMCTKAILAEKGTIDKFIGDAVMAFWNAPVPLPAHQTHAARAALLIREGLKHYNEEHETRALLEPLGVWPLGVRVGLASGPACVGNMGSADRFDYSVLGETVNTAARAESTCKRAGTDVVIAGKLTEETARLAVLPAGRAGMKGKSQAEPIYALLGNEAMAATREFQALREECAFLAKSLTAPEHGLASQLVEELALRNPSLKDYFAAMLKRPEDFAA